MTNEERAREFYGMTIDYGSEVPELVALLAAAQARGRAEERAAVVAWLRGRCSCETHVPCSDPPCTLGDRVERGEHVASGETSGAKLPGGMCEVCCGATFLEPGGHLMTCHYCSNGSPRIECDGCGLVYNMRTDRAPPSWFLAGQSPKGWLGKRVPGPLSVDQIVRRDYCPRCKKGYADVPFG